MKNLKILFFGLLLVLFYSCSKDEITESETISVTQTNPFGILMNEADDQNLPINTKIDLLKNTFKVPYTRVSIAIPNWSGTLVSFEQYSNAGLKILLNVSSKITSESEPPGPFITDMVYYSQKLNEILNKYKPEVLVVENEETNEGYYTGTAQEYINLLTVAIDVAHQKGVKVTNGGFPTRMATLLCWDYYNSTGQISKANSYALRAFPSSISGDIQGYINSNINAQQQLAKGKTLLNTYKNMNLDYINFHWYEIVSQREISAQSPELPNINTADMTAFEETVTFFKSFSGKQPITNEIGQINKKGGIVTDVLNKCFDLKLPYVVWYSGDGGVGKATALHNGDGTLRENGTSFKSFIDNKFK